MHHSILGTAEKKGKEQSMEELSEVEGKEDEAGEVIVDDPDDVEAA